MIPISLPSGFLVTVSARSPDLDSRTPRMISKAFVQFFFLDSIEGAGVSSYLRVLDEDGVSVHSSRLCLFFLFSLTFGFGVDGNLNLVWLLFPPASPLACLAFRIVFHLRVGLSSSFRFLRYS